MHPLQNSVNCGVVDVPHIRIPCQGAASAAVQHNFYLQHTFRTGLSFIGNPVSALCELHVVSSKCRCHFHFSPHEGSATCRFNVAALIQSFPGRGSHNTLLSFLCCSFQYFTARDSATPLSAVPSNQFPPLPAKGLRNSLSSFTSRERPEWLDVVSSKVAQQMCSSLSE